MKEWNLVVWYRCRETSDTAEFRQIPKSHGTVFGGEKKSNNTSLTSNLYFRP